MPQGKTSLSEDSLKLFHAKFLNMPIKREYYVDKISDFEFRAKFLKSFDNHKLLKFIGLNKRYNPHHVKAFYCNLEKTTTGIESRFKDCVVKFGYSDFTKHFDLKYEGSSLTVMKSFDYDRISFVQSIYVCL